MFSAPSYLTSLNPLEHLDPFQLVMTNLLIFVIQAIGIGAAAVSLVLILMSIDVVGSSTKPTRSEQLAEAPFFSLRSWGILGYLVGVPVFALSLATQIVSTVAKMDPVMAFYTVLTWIFAVVAAVVLLVIAWEAAANAIDESREERERKALAMASNEQEPLVTAIQP